MKERLLYIFRAARSSFKINGCNGSCSGAGPEENDQHSRLGSLTSSNCRHTGNGASCQLLGRNQVLRLRGSIAWAGFMLHQGPSNLVWWTFFNKHSIYVFVTGRKNYRELIRKGKTRNTQKECKNNTVNPLRRLKALMPRYVLMLDFHDMQKTYWAPNGSWWRFFLLKWPTEAPKSHHTDTA